MSVSRLLARRLSRGASPEQEDGSRRGALHIAVVPGSDEGTLAPWVTLQLVRALSRWGKTLHLSPALLTAQGAGVVTVRCTAARAFEGGAVRRYRRRVEVHADLVGDSGDLARLVFDAIADAPAPVPAARPAEPPPRAAEPAPAPKPPAHPAERLKGRAAACWAALELPPGGAMGLEEAKAFCTQHPAFEGVAPGRVANRWADVLGAWRTAGLVDDTGMVRNPAT